MSVTPTSLCRAGAVCAVAVGLMAPAAAVAKPDPDKKKAASDAPAVCSHTLPPGLAKKDGALPPGIAKKQAGDGPPCEGHPQPGGSSSSQATATATAAPAPAPVATTVANAAPRDCVGRRVFRLRLDRKGKVRRARVLLNGRAIPVSRGKRRTTVLIDLRRRVAGVYVVRTTVLTRRGRLVTGTHRYRVCG